VLRGLEYVVVAVLLIVVVVVLVYLWFSGYLDKHTNVAGQAGAAERFKVKGAFLAADGSVVLLIRNYGGDPVKVDAIYVYPVDSPKPLCVKQGVNVVIPPGTLATVETTLTCTASPTPGRSYVVKVVTTKGAEHSYIATVTSSLASGGGVGCSFEASSGKWFGSPDGSPERGFNELNTWVAAWGPSGGGVRIALMPGITPPDSTGTSARYTVELHNVQIGNLTVSGGNVSASIAGTMPDFMEVVRIWLEPGEYVIYDNEPRPAVVPPSTYQVYATLRAAPRSDIHGSTADLILTCGGTPTATITLRVPNPEEWGLRADIYTWTTPPPYPPPPWPPFGSGYTYRDTWSVGAIYFWLYHEPIDAYGDRLGASSSYFSSVDRRDTAPKWVAYWIDPAATSWRNWAVRFTGRLYVPWERIRVGVWHDDGVYVKLCSIDTGNSWWRYTAPTFDATSGTCAGAPGEYSVEVGYFERAGTAVLVFIIGPGDGNGAYVPTIDGAWFCPNFRWTGEQRGTCSGAWSFVSASPSVPHFRGTNYTPGSTDGGGTPRP
jgi:hypothetical protein